MVVRTEVDLAIFLIQPLFLALLFLRSLISLDSTSLYSAISRKRLVRDVCQWVATLIANCDYDGYSYSAFIF
jgi:hypothetical protein